jgi:hypothetical protein
MLGRGWGILCRTIGIPIIAVMAYPADHPDVIRVTQEIAELRPLIPTDGNCNRVQRELEQLRAQVLELDPIREP